MAKIDLREIAKMRAALAQEKQESSPDHDQQVTREKTIASPTLNSSKATPRKSQRKFLRLPVSEKEIPLTCRSFIPSECLIHKKNPRVQALLNLNNPKVASLKKAFETEKQRDPVLARWIVVDGNRCIEILDGSRRRFIGDAIYQEDPSFRLDAWVGEISDADADVLAKKGNDDRDDVSPWEIAQYLKSIEDENPEWSHEVIAAAEGRSQTSVTDLLSLATIPLDIVSLLQSPDLLTGTSGLAIVKILKGKSDKDVSGLLKKLRPRAPFLKAVDLKKSLLLLAPLIAKKATPSQNRKVTIKQGDTVRFEVGKNRKVAGQYKADFYGVTDDEYQAIMVAIEKILG